MLAAEQAGQVGRLEGELLGLLREQASISPAAFRPRRS
jgi:hypothetical protein